MATIPNHVESQLEAMEPDNDDEEAKDMVEPAAEESSETLRGKCGKLTRGTILKAFVKGQQVAVEFQVHARHYTKWNPAYAKDYSFRMQIAYLIHQPKPRHRDVDVNQASTRRSHRRRVVGLPRQGQREIPG
ncbi:hypothetical protein MMC29_002395 [Sticta canariensis]|nr:hypothetical protein [Sticta canariensis]